MLDWTAPAWWGDCACDAGYVSKLVVDRAFAGRGLGRALLRECAARVCAASRDLLRLDCLAANEGLLAYYRRAGFAQLGIVDAHGSPVRCF